MNYIIPEGNVLISFSGGRTSAYMLYKILEANDGLPDRAKVIFTNTGREMPETYDFIQECSNRWNIKVDWLEYDLIKLSEKRNRQYFKIVSHNSASRNGEPFLKVIKSKQTLPDALQRFCTVELKIRTITRYLKSLGWENWTNTVGIRVDESHRAKISKQTEFTNWFPLVSANITKQNILDFWKKQPFDLKVTPGFGNCDGCFLKSEKTISVLWKMHPDKAKWWSDLEKLRHGHNKRKRQFHKARTYEQIGQFVQQQGDWIFDSEDALCQANDGECTG
tara:strand:+ start:111 stop:944 length:834 start_codon:yes stop_codon:yes gene_type:complete